CARSVTTVVEGDWYFDVW
nr:immunoglobulin heavy chain junction region [Mus musculus]